MMQGFVIYPHADGTPTPLVVVWHVLIPNKTQHAMDISLQVIRRSTLELVLYNRVSVTAYRDAVDDPYTLREYKANATGTKFPEVLANAISSLTESTTGKDPELFKLFIQIVKDEGK
jgi:dihydrodipicolinate synthase/N-acetylneuraminate lyase